MSRLSVHAEPVNPVLSGSSASSLTFKQDIECIVTGRFRVGSLTLDLQSDLLYAPCERLQGPCVSTGESTGTRCCPEGSEDLIGPQGEELKLKKHILTGPCILVPSPLVPRPEKGSTGRTQTHSGEVYSLERVNRPPALIG
ncbi:hypothetical protein EYF80_056009 [Liparis tanakae]|uniref:Uncharacterized protein n=1 Tax=Liparis tanakae TaxID=230148 RepID=A0A4Z2EYI2_9TELE|nr:hypothetical protein EYF80_056009 [Liparis tanakae]